MNFKKGDLVVHKYKHKHLGTIIEEDRVLFSFYGKMKIRSLFEAEILLLRGKNNRHASRNMSLFQSIIKNFNIYRNGILINE